MCVPAGCMSDVCARVMFFARKSSPCIGAFRNII